MLVVVKGIVHNLPIVSVTMYTHSERNPRVLSFLHIDPIARLDMICNKKTFTTYRLAPALHRLLHPPIALLYFRRRGREGYISQSAYC